MNPKRLDDYGCSFGLEMDGRCHMLYCLFRTEKSKEPKEPKKIGKMLCPKDMTYEPGKKDAESIKPKLKDKTSFITKRCP